MNDNLARPSCLPPEELAQNMIAKRKGHYS